MTPMFQGEVQFRRYSDTSTQGQQLVFAVHGRDELEAFIGKEGKRFMAVLVEIGDDEQPVQEIAKPKPREYLGENCYWAVQRCSDPEFQKWIVGNSQYSTAYSMGTEVQASAELAAMVIRQWCGVHSRKELDTNAEAAMKFRTHVIGPWQKHQMARRSA